jgi:hypothetical protein
MRTTTLKALFEVPLQGSFVLRIPPGFGNLSGVVVLAVLWNQRGEGPCFISLEGEEDLRACSPEAPIEVVAHPGVCAKFN